MSISVGTAEREVTATSNAADSESGEATITVAVRHAGDDPMTVNVTQPLGGSGTVGPVSAPIYDSATDTYTYSAAYTPHPHARLDAYSTDNPDKDQVTVTASDGHGASTEITVDVEISPARAAILDEAVQGSAQGLLTGVAVGDDHTVYFTDSSGISRQLHDACRVTKPYDPTNPVTVPLGLNPSVVWSWVPTVSPTKRRARAPAATTPRTSR